MITKYCFRCGSDKLTDAFYCLNCECHSTCTYLQKRLAENVCKESEYLINKAKYSYSNYITDINCCHTCKYFMWHSLRWCPGCGQPQVKEHIKYSEMLEKYPDYRVGY